MTLAELQRQSKMTSMSQAANKKKDEEENEVNIEQLMDSLKEVIHNSYYNEDYQLGDIQDLNSKSLIQLLHEIELKTLGFMNEIEYIQNAG